MKISENCKNCESTKLMHKGQSYCVFFKNSNEIIIMKDDPDSCSFLDANDPEYKVILEEYKLIK